MTAININAFTGQTPRISEYLLADNAATEATNVLLSSGEIRPQRQTKWAVTPSSIPPWRSAFRAEHQGQEQWLAWSLDVDVAIAPLSEDVEPRYYWSGDGEPRYALFSELPDDLHAIGIPKPQTAPSVAPSGGSGATVSRAYAYTFFSALGEESAPSALSGVTTGKVDDTWAITGMDDLPANTGTVSGVYAAGVTTFDNTVKHWLRPGDKIMVGVTEVSVGATPSATTFTVPGDLSSEVAWYRVAPWRKTGMKRRLYRSAGTSATLQLVHDDVGTSYNDTLTDEQILGDECISYGWEPPPVGLQGMISLPNGCLVGFIGNQVVYSEPYQPHAWPYSYGTDYEVVGIAAFGNTVVACTAGSPHVLSGLEPDGVTVERDDRIWPCMSKRSVISSDGGVLYASIHGMIHVGPNGSRTWSESLFTREEWSPLNPASMVSGVTDGRVFVSYSPSLGSPKILIFHDGGLALTAASIPTTDLYSDPRNGRMYVVNEAGIYEWNAEGSKLIPYTWKSKEFTLPTPVNLACAKVDFSEFFTAEDQAAAEAEHLADRAANQARITARDVTCAFNSFAYNKVVEVNGDDLINPRNPDDLRTMVFTLYVNRKVRFTKRVTSDDPFRLPAGYKSDNYAVRVYGTVRVRSIKLADTMLELKRV